jgi:hypothetical protein
MSIAMSASRKSLLRILHCQFERRTGNSYGKCRHRGPGVVQGDHGDLESFPFLAQKIPGRHLHILEENVRRVGGTLPHLVFLLADGDAGERSRHDESGKSLVPLGAVRGSEHRVLRGIAPVRDEALATVENVVVSLLLGGRRDPSRVGSRPGLRETEGGVLKLLREGGYESFLLIVRPRDEDRGQREPVAGHGGSDSGTSPPQLLLDDAGIQRGNPQSAILLRDEPAHQAEPERFLQDILGELPRVVVLHRFGADLVGGEFSRHVLKRNLFLRQFEGDHVLPPLFLAVLHNPSAKMR